MDKGKQSCKQNVITKNDNILVRCERGWKERFNPYLIVLEFLVRYSYERV
jgi:hypothetical protein